MNRGILCGTVLVLGLVLVAAPLASAVALVRDAPPYVHAKTFASKSTQASGGGRNSVSTSANTTNGTVVVYAISFVVGSGTASMTTREGFTGPSFTLSASGNHTVVYKWRISWTAGVRCVQGTLNCVTSHTIKLFGNLFDATTVSWVSGGAVTLPGNGQSNQTVLVKFNVSLTGGDTYLFHTGLFTFTSAAASGGSCGLSRCVASAFVNVEFNGDAAHSIFMEIL
jgi:hypothetical protein